MTASPKVGKLQRGRDRRDDARHAGGRHRRLDRDLLREARAAQQLHHHVGLRAGVHAEVQDTDDAGVAQLGAGAALAQEPLVHVGRGLSDGLHDLDGDVIPQPEPAGAVDLPHPARPERAEYLVAVVDACAGGEHGAGPHYAARTTDGLTRARAPSRPGRGWYFVERAFKNSRR